MILSILFNIIFSDIIEEDLQDLIKPNITPDDILKLNKYTKSKSVFF